MLQIFLQVFFFSRNCTNIAEIILKITPEGIWRNTKITPSDTYEDANKIYLTLSGQTILKQFLMLSLENVLDEYLWEPKTPKQTFLMEKHA